MRMFMRIFYVEEMMHKRMSITLDEAVYDGLVRVIGRGKISQFLENLAKPYLAQNQPAELAAAYREMAADTQREQDALEWCNALIGDAVP